MATKGAKVEFGWIDGSNERTRTQLHVAFDDTTGTVAALQTAANTLRVALETMTELNETKVSAVIPVHSAAATLPTSPWAQREGGLRIYYADTVTGKNYHADLPGVDETALRQPGTDVPASITNLNTFQAAFEATVVSEFGNPVLVTGFKLYGKNL